MASISERADRFAKRFVKSKPRPDERSLDERMASFEDKWGKRRAARDKVKKISNA